MKKIIAGLAAASGFLGALPAFAQDELDVLVNQGLNYATKAGLGTKDVREVIFLIINVILGFLSIIAVVGIFFGGFQMMIAGGDEEKAGNGKKAIVAGVIGLVVIFSAWAIAAFVVRSLVNITAA